MPSYDLTIIGCGIHGAGVAQAAAAKGYRVLLLEKTAVAAGTSSRSSKLIHGGLRYLETAQFSLVRECLREREILLRNAPELVKLERFYIPIYRQTSRSQYIIRAGLSLYALMGGLKKSSRFHSVPKSQWPEMDGLRTKDLQQVFRYSDAQTDDAALTHAVLNSAVAMGAEVKLPATFVSAELRPSDCVIRYCYDGKEFEVQSTVLINAAGPWINQILSSISPKLPPLELDLVQGTHIVINRELKQGFYYLESPSDQRAIFAMPWKGKLLLGTTESKYNGIPEKVKPLQQELDYLVDIYTHYFPESPSSGVPLIDSFAGLRVLPASKKTVFKRSRETQLIVDNEYCPKLLTILGGKLTSYRATAQNVMRRLQSELPVAKKYADTANIPLVPDL